MQSFYGTISSNLQSRFKNIKLLVCDVDGVFSDGRIYLGNNGEELKAFHTKDGFGMKALVVSGITTAVITGRKSHIVQQRMQALNVAHIIQGCEDKLPALKLLAKSLNLSLDEIAYIGDDIPDLPCITQVGLGIAVQDAHPQLINNADYTTVNRGGFGAVREICDIIMLAQNSLQYATGASV